MATISNFIHILHGKNIVSMSSAGIIKSVNWHLISACNYQCKFCFARNLGEAPVSFERGLEIIQSLVDLGMDKINFAGGEPLLHPRLLDYCAVAKDHGMTVSITTNGMLLKKDLIGTMQHVVDWIALSIDSGSNETEALLGRGYGNHVTHCSCIAPIIRDTGIHLKVNTTVTSRTFCENMESLIQELKPDRWKVLQMLHIQGDNDDAVEDLAITSEQFNYFVENNSQVILENGESPVFESCNMIENSYFMITPEGNVKIDKGNVITKFTLTDVINRGVDMIVDPVKYQNRGGLYEWNQPLNNSI